MQRRVQTTKEPLVPRPDHYNHFTENYHQRAWLEATQRRTERVCVCVEDRRYTRVRKAAGGPGPLRLSTTTDIAPGVLWLASCR